jgi:hypothetical protein
MDSGVVAVERREVEIDFLRDRHRLIGQGACTAQSC